MNKKILFVDDDEHILFALRRQLRGQFDVETALGGAKGLETIEGNGPFAVVVADMRMPIMDGIEFLARVKEREPDTVRMMLTGNADLQTAVNAVNQGNIFRFLLKPCPTEVLWDVLDMGIAQYRLITAERELLEKTLGASVKLLTEILSLVNPVAFSRALRVRGVVTRIAQQLQLSNMWQFELAAMLSQIGCVTFPPEILDKIYVQTSLTSEEERMYNAHPSIGQELLANIPRLEIIAQIVAGQIYPSTFPVVPAAATTEESRVALGSQLLKLALDFEQLSTHGLSPQAALSVIRSRNDTYNPYLINALESICQKTIDRGSKEVTIKELKIGMITDQIIWAKNGMLLVHKDQEITYPLLVRLHNYSKKIGIAEPVRVHLSPGESLN